MAAALAGGALAEALAAGCADGDPAAAPESKAYRTALAFTQCMRCTGSLTSLIPPTRGSVGFTMGPGIDPHSPLFRSAQQACRTFGSGGAG